MFVMRAVRQPGARAPRSTVARLCARRRREDARCGGQGSNIANSVRDVGGCIETVLSLAGKDGLHVRW